MKNKKILRLTLDAVLCALIAILSFVPYIGFIPLGFTSVTDVHVVVIIGAILLGPVDGLILGTWFGICSLIKSFSGTAGDLTFSYFWVSVLPRMAFGYLTGWLNIWFSKIIKNKTARIGVVSALATICHTILVYIPYVPTAAFVYFGKDLSFAYEGKIGNLDFTASLWLFCLASFGFSCIFETILSVLVSIPVNRSLEAAYGDSILSYVKKESSSKEDTDSNIK